MLLLDWCARLIVRADTPLVLVVLVTEWGSSTCIRRRRQFNRLGQGSILTCRVYLACR